MSAPPTPKTVSWVTERIARREGFTIDPASANSDQPRLPEGYAVAHGAFFYGLPGDLTEVCVLKFMQLAGFVPPERMREPPQSFVPDPEYLDYLASLG